MNLTLSDFIQSEMKKRDMGVVEFAKFVGVTHSTISKHLGEKAGVPSEDFLVKLSDATTVSLETIFGLAFPRVANRMPVSPKAMLLAQRFDQLPESVQDFILRAVLSQ